MILRRLPDSRFSVVAPEWKGRAAVIIGGGPSLTAEQVALVKIAHDAGRVRCIAVNDAYLWCDFAEILYAADAHWHQLHRAGVNKPLLKLSAAQVRERFLSFAGEKCSIQSQMQGIVDDRTHILRNARTDPNGRGIHANGLSLDPGALFTGSNSGWQAFNVAVLAGGNPIILLGMDGQVAPDGQTHFHGGHQQPTPEQAYAAYRSAWDAGEAAIKKLGITVWNCAPRSAVHAFPRIELQKALDALSRLSA